MLHVMENIFPAFLMVIMSCALQKSPEDRINFFYEIQ